MKNKRSGSRKSAARANHMELVRLEPLTQKQADMFGSSKNIVAHGAAGTGKTMCATYLGLDDLDKEKYSKLVYIRSVVPTRDMGFLPGTDKEKAEVYEAPYKDIMSELYGRGDAYEVLKSKGDVVFMTTSFLRGTTLRDSVIIIDECQNMSYHELDSIITRIGENCRVFFCGDMFQADLEKNGISKFYDVLKTMESFDFIQFDLEDIVRSKFVKEYLTCKYKTYGARHVE